jgi:hypothetical protein
MAESLTGSESTASNCSTSCPELKTLQQEITEIQLRIGEVGCLGWLIGLDTYYKAQIKAIRREERELRSEQIFTNCPGASEGQCFLYKEDSTS